MSKRLVGVDKGLSNQGGLFDTGFGEGAFDVSLGLRQCFSREITASRLDRYRVAAELSRLTKSTISKEMLDKFTGSDPAYGMRAEVLTAFCAILGTLEPFSYLLEPLGCDVLTEADKDLVELARLQEQEKAIQMKIMSIRQKRNLK
jgi:hypothetical protein